MIMRNTKMKMKNRLLGFIVGIAVSLSVAAYSQDWSKHELRELIRDVVESSCEVDDRGDIDCG